MVLPEKAILLRKERDLVQCSLFHLANRLAKKSVLICRDDGRYDLPDEFRAGAALLKKGGVALKAEGAPSLAEHNFLAVEEKPSCQLHSKEGMHTPVTISLPTSLVACKPSHNGNLMVR